MPTSSSAARAFGVMSSSTSAATPALSARYGSPLSSATALKIASAIGLRQMLAVHTKRICLVWFSAVSPLVIYPLSVYPFGLLHAPSTVLSRDQSSPRTRVVEARWLIIGLGSSQDGWWCMIRQRSTPRPLTRYPKIDENGKRF